MARKLRLTRELVCKIPATIPDPGPIAEIADLQSSEVQAQTLQHVLQSRPDPSAFWIFAFGSLMWKPDFDYVEQRRARVEGWQRSFCLGPDTRYRGNPDKPGIMLSLEPGGSCEGVAFRLDETGLQESLAALIEREPPIPPQWIGAETENGTISTLAFVSNPQVRRVVAEKSVEDIARQIAPAVGIYGSMADYVHNTAMHLEEMGIHDPLVWQMQELVAKELEQMP
ncbi:MAG: gamma-glutamylcyclotransferase [Hyphomicrobiaceae bacterium]|nr:gamma-glutamylcyclotransferase [Hyphomicrobiaceae bacterium]MCC0022793.1 gamma-glutamylcyclotransferase [Hyphomicrobiaceae bacterium]